MFHVDLAVDDGVFGGIEFPSGEIRSAGVEEMADAPAAVVPVFADGALHLQEDEILLAAGKPGIPPIVPELGDHVRAFDGTGPAADRNELAPRLHDDID